MSARDALNPTGMFFLYNLAKGQATMGGCHEPNREEVTLAVRKLLPTPALNDRFLALELGREATYYGKQLSAATRRLTTCGTCHNDGDGGAR